jgi:hypothetical protein
MLKKKSFYIVTLILAIALTVVTYYFKVELKSFSGLLVAISAGLFGISIANIFMIHLEQKEPKFMKKGEIEFKDERNTIIRNRAKAKAADIIQWFIMGIAYLTIIINAPLWVTLATVCVFLLYNILSVYLMNKYQKEM